MKRGLTTIIFLWVFVAAWAVKPYFRLGQSHKSVHDLTADVTRLLLSNSFEILGMYHPNKDESLCVIVFTCDEMTSMSTSVTDKGAFGAALKIGLVGHDGVTDISFLNPHYLKHAYFHKSANRFEAVKMTMMADSLVKDALKPLVSDSMYYGNDIPKEELWTYHFLPTMPRYEDVVLLNEYHEYLEAVATIKTNLLKSIDDCELVYEMTFDDKEIAVFGVAFHGKNNPDKEMISLLGRSSISSMPVEILVQGNKAYMLNGRYRLPLFKTGLSKMKTFKILDIASDIKSHMKNITRWKEK